MYILMVVFLVGLTGYFFWWGSTFIPKPGNLDDPNFEMAKDVGLPEISRWQQLVGGRAVRFVGGIVLVLSLGYLWASETLSEDWEPQLMGAWFGSGAFMLTVGTKWISKRIDGALRKAPPEARGGIEPDE